MQKVVDLGVLLSASLSLARQASRIIRHVSQGELVITQKGRDGQDDPMTQADEQSQKLIIAGLWSVYPGLAVVGEEEGECKWCDLDGCGPLLGRRLLFSFFRD